ncbi:cysteine proteinase inhibitor 1-like [Salvia divinorum]|uniref:Cysteine proteinase inhibitor 1-like n=1 Tax=Salvia divinorum TaxID=28513 RepID=A0ABD1GEF8_SALDI
MASSITLTASFFGGPVAAKPSAATTRRGPLAVRASMDLEKAVAESSNTRRGLVLAGMAAAAAAPSIVKVAMADDENIGMPGAYNPVPNPNAPEIVQIALFALSDHNKQKKEALVYESMIKAEMQVVNGFNYRLTFVARDTRTSRTNNYQAIVYFQPVPTFVNLVSFVAILR